MAIQDGDFVRVEFTGKSADETLEILLEVTEENEELKGEIETLRKKLRSKAMMIENAGSLAEASLKISGVFERAQLAADVYLRNLKRMEKQMKQKQAFLDGMISKEEYENLLQEETRSMETTSIEQAVSQNGETD